MEQAGLVLQFATHMRLTFDKWARNGGRGGGKRDSTLCKVLSLTRHGGTFYATSH